MSRSAAPSGNFSASAPCPPDFNLAAHVLAPALEHPDKPALELVGAARPLMLDFGTLRGEVRRCAARLRAAGLSPGARLLMRMDNCIQFPIVFLGAVWAGILPVPTSAQLTVPEITAMTEELKPQAMVLSRGVARPEQQIGTVLSPAQATSGPAPESGALPPHPGAPERPAYVIFTSGTSGRARGVVHAHRAVWARRMMWRDWYDLRPDDRLLHAGAFNWTFTLGTGLLDPWAAGATALIPVPGTDAAELGPLLARHRASLFAAAPGVFRRMLRAGLPPLPRLRHALSAGEKLPETIARRWREATQTDIHEAYGMSECSTFVSSCPRRPAPPGTVGYPQDGRRVAVLRDGRPVGPGIAGTIAVASDDPGLMLHYLDAPEEAPARSGREWFETGDSGRFDETGALCVLGRNDDMLNAGGFRVSPVEVENALSDFPGLTACAAVEVRVRPDTGLIALCYTSEHPLEEAALRAHAEARLARYKQPRLYRRLESLPLSANGKIDRRRLRGLEWSLSTPPSPAAPPPRNRGRESGKAAGKNGSRCRKEP